METKPFDADNDISLDEYFGGKCWAAKLVRRDPQAPGGLVREFLPTTERQLSRSGKTGTRWVSADSLSEGDVVETQEPRPKLGRRYWIVQGQALVEVHRNEAVRRLPQA